MISRTRVPDWNRRLREVLSRYRGAGVAVVGVTDCGTLWADAVLAVSGVDVLGDLRGTYYTPDEARIALALAGVGSAHELADARFPRVPLFDLQRGDLAFAPSILIGDIASPAVVDVGHAFTVGPSGLTAFPLGLATHGWAV